MMSRPSCDPAQLVARLTRALEPRAEILDAYLFGSRARGDAHGQSDVVVAVYIDKSLADDGQWGYRAELTTVLMDALGTNDVDVVVLNQAPPLLYHRVLRDGVLLVTRDLQAPPASNDARSPVSRVGAEVHLDQNEVLDRSRRP